MFAVIYQFKFPGVSEAKVPAGFCSESLGGKIAEYDFLGLNILGGTGEAFHCTSLCVFWFFKHAQN